MALSSRALFALVLLVGVAGTGIAVRLANMAGYGTLGSLIWFLGYGTTIFLLWYGWFRKMEITGQTDPDEIADATESSEANHDTTES
jgi:hypothetical protein